MPRTRPIWVKRIKPAERVVEDLENLEQQVLPTKRGDPAERRKLVGRHRVQASKGEDPEIGETKYEKLASALLGNQLAIYELSGENRQAHDLAENNSHRLKEEAINPWASFFSKVDRSTSASSGDNHPTRTHCQSGDYRISAPVEERGAAWYKSGNGTRMLFVDGGVVSTELLAITKSVCHDLAYLGRSAAKELLASADGGWPEQLVFSEHCDEVELPASAGRLYGLRVAAVGPNKRNRSRALALAVLLAAARDVSVSPQALHLELLALREASDISWEALDKESQREGEIDLDKPTGAQRQKLERKEPLHEQAASKADKEGAEECGCFRAIIALSRLPCVRIL